MRKKYGYNNHTFKWSISLSLKLNVILENFHANSLHELSTFWFFNFNNLHNRYRPWTVQNQCLQFCQISVRSLSYIFLYIASPNVPNLNEYFK